MVNNLYNLTTEEIKIVEGEIENADWVDKNPGQFFSVQLNSQPDIFRHKCSVIPSEF